MSETRTTFWSGWAARAGTPAHLVTPETEPDPALFQAVTTELGDLTLGPPGMTPAELRQGGS